jgi:hypothetical protein
MTGLPARKLQKAGSAHERVNWSASVAEAAFFDLPLLFDLVHVQARGGHYTKAWHLLA